MSAPFPVDFHNSGIDTFIGTLGDSEPGSFAFIAHTHGIINSDGSQTFETTWTVVPDSGTGGLKGICGGGTSIGSGPPFVTTYDFTFRFGEACNSEP